MLRICKTDGGLAAVLAAAALSTAAPVLAQTPPADPAVETTTVEDIVVTARRSGAPMWEVTRGDATVILVGDILGVPEATPWRPQALEAATLRAQRVIAGLSIQASFSDLLRLVWRGRTLTRLPGETTSADYLGPEWEVRLQALGAAHRQDYSRQSFLIASSDLLNDRLRFNRDTTDRAAEVVRRAARRARIPVTSVEGGRGDVLVETLLTEPPERLVPCMQAAIAATEAGPDSLIARGRDWTRFRVAAVLASPLEQALGQCWPWGDPAVGPGLKAAWTARIDEALNRTGVTMAVAPLNLLGEPGGVLDRLEAQGLEVEGPAWREG